MKVNVVFTEKRERGISVTETFTQQEIDEDPEHYSDYLDSLRMEVTASKDGNGPSWGIKRWGVVVIDVDEDEIEQAMQRADAIS